MSKLFTFVSMCAFMYLCIAPSYATESSLTIAPALLEVITEPGKVTKTTITITNNTDFPLPVKGQANAFISNEPLPRESIDTFNSAAWFTLDPADFILQPRESKAIKVSIKPPKKTEPGGHYATIYFEPLIPEGIISAGSSISLSRIGVLTFLIVPGDIHEVLQLSSFTTAPWATFGPVSFDFVLRNSGNIHLLPTGKLVIKDFFGKVVGQESLEHITVLPSTEIAKSIEWSKQFLFGRYSADLTVNYGNNHDPLTTKSLIFWVIPWPIILVVIALLTLLYKIFIVHIDRLKLAIKVLKGKDVHETQNIPQPPSVLPRPHRGSHSTHSRPKRSHRRQSHKP